LIWRRRTPKLGLAIAEGAAAAISNDFGRSCNSQKACIFSPKTTLSLFPKLQRSLLFSQFSRAARDLQTIHNLTR